MVAQFSKISEHQQLLIAQLKTLPREWALTPVKGNKACYRTNWQFEKPLSHKAIASEIKSGKAKGFGIRTGTVSGGIVAIDADGPAAHEKILELSSGQLLPETIAFTSNKPGRCQYLFYIPEEYWEAVSTKKIDTGIKGDDGKEQKLELRWDGCQSVLPPSAHPETGCYRWVKSPKEIAIAPAPMWVIEAMLVESEPTQQEPVRHPTSYSTKLRSGEEWSSQEWALSYLCALSSYRADDYADWVAVGMALHSVSDSLLTEWDNWSRQSSKYKPGDCEKKWKSFKRQGVAIGSLGHMAKQDGWRSPFEKTTGRGKSGKRHNFGGGSGGSGGGDGGDGGGNQLEVVSLYKRIEEVLNRQLPDPQQEDAFLNLAKAERVSLSDVKGIAKELQVQTERAADLKEDSSQFKKLVSFREQQLNLNATFPTPLAKALLSKADSSRLDPIRLVQNLLPACGAVLGANVSVIAKRGVTERDHWYEYAIFWTADISPPSSGKSDAQRASFEPLKEMEREELKRVAEAKKRLPQIKKNWQNFTDQQKEEHQGTDADPEFFKSEYVDKVRRYIWDEATIEALFRLISEQPEKAGTTWVKDELEALFKGLDQHKSGNKGNALQQLLSSWSGPLWGTTDRVDKTKSYRLLGQTLNISGTVQPDVITKRLNVRDDPDGLTSRLLPAMSKLPADFSQWSDVQVELFDCIKELLEGLEQMQGIVEFSPVARTRWIQRWEELRRGYQRYLESNPAYAYFLGKQCSYVPRLALLLHCIEHYYQPKSNFAQISLETLEKAITLSDYYCGQFRLLQAASFSQDEFPLEGLLFKVWEKVKALGKISTREVCQFARRHKWHGKKITAGVALEILTAIQTAGFGVLRGKTLYLNSPDNFPPMGLDHVDHVDQMLIIDQHGKTLIDEGVEGFVDHVAQRDDQQIAAISNGGTIAEESSLYSLVDQPDQQMAKAQDSQDLEHVDQLPTFDQHDQQNAIAPTPAKVDTAGCENPVTPAEIAPEAVPTSVEDEIGVKDEPTEKETRWAWNKTTGESLGEVLCIRGSQAKIRRSGELSRHAKFYPLQEITFDNPVVQALSLNASEGSNRSMGIE